MATLYDLKYMLFLCFSESYICCGVFLCLRNEYSSVNERVYQWKYLHIKLIAARLFPVFA